uniref:Secreted protein n=1 Tax=Streptomyces sp. NBC_01401 TaxID=2903854 RepID=A0AAU3GVZ3_9ACTN
MDEGLVALVAAGVGLVGAIGGAAIGGLAAARGARIGAETAAKATAKQVHDQAVVDQEHWLREQRLDACRALLAAYDAYAIGASNVTRAVEGELTGTRELGLSFGQSLSDFRNAYFQVRLVGPGDVREQALLLRRSVEEHQDCVDKWLHGFLDMDRAVTAAAKTEEETLRFRLGGIHDAFLEAVTHSMTHLPQRS